MSIHMFLYDTCCLQFLRAFATNLGLSGVSHTSLSLDEPYGWLQMHLRCSDSIDLLHKLVKMNFNLKLLIYKNPKPYFFLITLFP